MLFRSSVVSVSIRHYDKYENQTYTETSLPPPQRQKSNARSAKNLLTSVLDPNAVPIDASPRAGQSTYDSESEEVNDDSLVCWRPQDLSTDLVLPTGTPTAICSEDTSLIAKADMPIMGFDVCDMSFLDNEIANFEQISLESLQGTSTGSLLQGIDDDWLHGWQLSTHPALMDVPDIS